MPLIAIFPEPPSEAAEPAGGSSVMAPAPPAALMVLSSGSSRAERPAYSKSAAESPGCTAYQNSSVEVPFPPLYVAFRGGSVPSANAGSPATTTGPLNSTSTATILPVPYVPSASGEETDRTSADMPSTATAEAASEPRIPGPGSSRSAAAPPMPVIVPRVCRAPVPA